ncbi:MAG: hypothetical protein H6832_03345 [Planctomycetes bacterium]|nr:hypothetical protein [Planctomycetota bacterium]
MFSKEEFQTWAKDNVVLFASIMTRIEGREDDALLKDYGFRGFPSMAILDGSGDAITKKVARELPAMKESVAACNAYAKTKAKVDAGEDVDPAEWFLTRLALGQFSVDEAKEAAAELELTESQKATYDKALLGLELDGLMASARNPAGQKAAAEAVYAFYKAGRVPAAGSQQESFFMAMLGSAADSKNDGDAYLVAGPHLLKQAKDALKRIEDMREGFKGDPKRIEEAIDRMKKQVTDIEAKLESFKKG